MLLNKKSLLILPLCLSVLFGCVARRFDSVVGHPKSYALDVLGPPKQTVKVENEMEVWIYPVSSRVTTNDVDEGSDASPVTQILAQGIADSIISGIGLNEPHRYLFIDRSGKIVRWEAK